jgi:hypothetical protein
MAGQGDPVGPDGLRGIDVVSELGTHHAAIADISKDVATIKKAVARRGLADAGERRAA